MTTLTIIAPGTSMRWEDMALYLGWNIGKAHNLNEPAAEHYYFSLDGLAAKPDQDHPTASSVKFDPRDPDRLLSGVTTQTEGQRKRDQILGIGMDQNAQAIHDLVAHIRDAKDITEINVVGFSRGAATCPKIARKLYEDPALKDLPVNLLMMDPVPGPGHKKEKGIASVTPNVKKYISQQSVAECAALFEPMDKSRVTFESDDTKYLFLPVPDDHLMAVMWGADLTKEFLGTPGVLYKEEGLAEAQQALYDKRFSQADGTRQKRVDAYREARGKYERQTLSPQSDDPRIQLERNKQDVEAYYEQTFNKGRAASIQSDASEKDKRAQELSGYINSRRVTRELGRYTDVRFFTNDLHESLFQRAYPNLYFLIKKHDNVNLDSVREELGSMLKESKAFFKSRHGIDENSSDQNLLALTNLDEIKVPGYATNLKAGHELIEFMRPTSMGDVFSARRFSQELQATRIQDLNFEQYHDQKVRYVVQNANQVKKWQSQVEGQTQPALQIIKVLESKILDTDWNIRLGGVDVVLESEDKTARISHTMKDILDVFSREKQKGDNADWDKALSDIQTIGHRKAVKKSGFSKFTRSKSTENFYSFFQKPVLHGTSEKAPEKTEGEQPKRRTSI